jgi:hypothetical protein
VLTVGTAKKWTGRVSGVRLANKLPRAWKKAAVLPTVQSQHSDAGPSYRLGRH